MPGELTATDVYKFTGGRLEPNDDEVVRLLNAALALARRECGWSVNPVVTDQSVILDGPGSRILSLPTRKLVELTSITEDDVSVPLSTVRWSAGGPPGILDRPVSVRKKSHGWWSPHYQAIEVTMTHGYDDTEAADWRYAVLSMVDQMSQTLVSGRGELDLLSKKVDDVTYRWADPYDAMASEVIHSVSGILSKFKLPTVDFL